MKRSILFIFVIICSAGLNCFGQIPKWYKDLIQIKPMVTSRGDLERIFNSPQIDTSFVEDNIESVFYKHSEGHFSVEYSTGKCSAKDEDGYEVGKDVVLRIMFFPTNWPKTSILKIDKSQYEKSQDPHDLAWHYLSRELGTDISFRQGRVGAIELFPGSEYDNKKCVKEGTSKTAAATSMQWR